MMINADFSRQAIVRPDEYQWVTSPGAGVSRMMLDRVGGERARATSLVKYKPGSVFPPHAHPGGEEIFVLDGIFSDETGDYPAGWYLRNPPGSSHSPSNRDGATLFVKLQQMVPSDDATMRIDTSDSSNWHTQPRRRVCHLYARGREHVALHAVEGGQAILPAWQGCLELLVIDGVISSGKARYTAGSWLRLPVNNHDPFLSADDHTMVLMKTGVVPCMDNVGILLENHL